MPWDLIWLDLREEHAQLTYDIAWQQTSDRNPYLHLGCLRILCPSNRYPAALLGRAEQSSFLYAFTVGQIGSLAFCPPALSDRLDITSPYGYGGPVWVGLPLTRESSCIGIQEAMGTYFNTRGIVAEFVREDLELAQYVERNAGTRVWRQNNVIVPLSQDVGEAERLQSYRQKVRKNVRRAKESGLEVVFDKPGAMMEQFSRIYSETMTRVEASEYHKSLSSSLKLLYEELAKDDAVFLAHVLHGEDVVASEMILTSRTRMFSFLGGSRREAMQLRPNDLLKHELILWGSRSGYRQFVLGGGVSPDDGIYRYKLAFAPSSGIPFYTRHVIHDEEAYRVLSRARMEYGGPPLKDYFPSYRG